MAENQGGGFVYVFSNPRIKDLKIGYTQRQPECRADELYTTGVPAPFKVEYHAYFPDCSKAEKEVHEKLDSYRVPDGREFFNVSLPLAIDVIRNIEGAVETYISVDAEQQLEESKVVKTNSDEDNKSASAVKTINQNSTNKVLDKYGYIYVLSAVFSKNLIKIRYSKTSVKERVGHLNKHFSNQVHLKLEYYACADDCEAITKTVLNKLSDYESFERRGFLTASLGDVITTIESLKKSQRNYISHEGMQSLGEISKIKELKDNSNEDKFPDTKTKITSYTNIFDEAFILNNKISSIRKDIPMRKRILSFNEIDNEFMDQKGFWFLLFFIVLLMVIIISLLFA